MIDQHNYETRVFTLYGSPKGKPKQKRKLDTAYDEERAAAAALKWLLKGYTLRMVVSQETYSRWD